MRFGHCKIHFVPSFKLFIVYKIDPEIILRHNQNKNRDSQQQISHLSDLYNWKHSCIYFRSRIVVFLKDKLRPRELSTKIEPRRAISVTVGLASHERHVNVGIYFFHRISVESRFV